MQTLKKIKKIFGYKILSVEYELNGRKTSCIIRWTIPSTGEVRRTKAGTVCAPGDVYDTDKGKKIAKCRAFKTLNDTLQEIYHNYADKVRSLSRQCYRKSIDYSDKIYDLIND